jgi:hypothetical protein
MPMLAVAGTVYSQSIGIRPIRDHNVALGHFLPRNIKRCGTLAPLDGSAAMSNPKTEPTSNTKKDPDEWLSGDDPMTGAQASYLRTLCEQAGTPELFDDGLTKAAASKLIDEMREKAHIA